MQLMDVAGNWLSDTKFNLMMYEFINGKLFIKAGELYNQIDAFGQLTSEELWNYLFVDSRCAEAALYLNKEILDFTGEGVLWKRTIRLPNEKKETYLIQGEKSYLVPETWTQFKWLSVQLVAYCENDLWGIADYACNIVMPAQWLFAPDKVNIEEDIWLVVDPSTEEWKWIHSSGETVLSMASGESMYILNQNRYIIDDNEVFKGYCQELDLLTKVPNTPFPWYNKNKEGMEHDGAAERSNEYGDFGYSRINSTRSLTSENQSDGFV